jgi:chromosome segregation ATPase
MSRSSAASMFAEDEPVLRFEESSTPVARTRKAQLAAESAPEIDDASYGSLKRKQEELLNLRQQLERTERETSQLEVQRGKEERFSTGRREMGEKLSRSLVRLDRELYNSQKAIEEITTARDLYQHHLEIIRGLHPEAWKRGDLDGELDRAIAAIDDAEVEFGKTSRRLAATLPGEALAESALNGNLPRGFVSWLTAGFAFTLPALLALPVVAYIVFKYLR